MSPPPTLLVTDDERLVEEVSSLASASGVSVAVTAAAAAAAPAWESAPLVLLGEDALERPVPSRRPGVLVLTSDGPGGEELWRSALLAGAEQVLSLPDERAALLRRLGDVAEVPGHGEGRCVAVLGVRGGVGTSPLATALAHRAARAAHHGAATLLVDTDLLGGGLDLAVGLEDAPGLRWGDLSQARGSVRGLVLAQSLPRRGSLAVLASGGQPGTGPLRGDVVEAVLRAARPHHGAVVVDVARGADAITAAALTVADVLLLLVPRDIGAVVAARRVLEVLDPVVADVRLVLRAGLGPGPGGPLPAAAVVDELGVPPAVVLAHDRGLAAALGRGEVAGTARRGPLAQACDALEPLMAPSESTSAARRGPAPTTPSVPAPW